jgi:glycosyltransferase involved in cell wall biosynthesis
MNNQPLVSVVITTKNEEKNIRNILESLKIQSYKNIEIIVVDNNSTDRTKEIAQEYTDKVFNKGPERSSQRNFGVKQARGEYVLILDADMILAPEVIKECVEVISQDKEVKQLIIPEISEGEGFWAKVKAFERSFYIGDETIEAARFFEKRIFEEFEGYDERIRGGGEEYDLPERILDAGYRQSRINALIKHQEGHLTLWQTMKTKYYYGKTAGIYIKKHPENARKKIKILRPAFLRHKRKLLKHPILTIAMLFMKFCEFGAGGIGYLISKIKTT